MVQRSPAETANPRSTILRMVGPGALIFCATILAYLPALSGDFIWNDSDYVTAPALRSLHGLVRIWTEPGATQQYYPLLHGAFWVQHRIFGDHPFGYHLVTLFLHAGSAVLFALVLRRLGAGGHKEPDAVVPWLAALLFALHPVHVESVAWITEQKNTLSLAFYLAALLVYLRFDETRRPRTYVAALALFVASLLCKTVTATLPAALLVIFWWQRGRIGWRRDVLPLLPWLAVGAASGLFSSWVERVYVGAEGAEFSLSLAGRALVAGRAIWFYAGKLIWPFGLNFIYPHWTIDATVWWQWLFPLGVLAVAVGLWALRGRSRAPLAVFLLFVGSLFPVLGFVNLYGELYSWVWDHWQYLPDLGPLALAAGGLAAGWRRVVPRVRWAGPALAGMLGAALGFLTWSHCKMFHDDQTLYRTTIARNPGCWMAHHNLGLLLAEMPGRLDDAIAEYQEVLRLKPDHAKAHGSLGAAWLRKPGRLNDAIAELQEALRLAPDNINAHYNLGVAWSQLPGRRNDVIAQYEVTLRLKPDHVEARNNLGAIWSQLPGRLNDAIAQYREALRLQPDYAEAHFNLGVAWAQIPGRLDDAIAEYQEALRLQPDYVDAHLNLGVAWSKVPGRLNDANAQYREVVRLRPDFAQGWHNLGVNWYRLGKLAEAAAAFREELKLSPNNPAAEQALAAILQQTQGH